MDVILRWLVEAKLLGISAYIWVAALLVVIAVLLVLSVFMNKKGRRTAPRADAVKREGMRTLEPHKTSCGLEVSNVHGIGARSYQQDAFAVSPLGDATLCESKGVLLALADGMGGMTDGGKASAIVIDTLLKGFLEGAFAEDPSVGLASLLYSAGAKVQSLDNSGSTAIGAVVRGGKLYFAACGDSRLALFRGGALLTLNREQNYAVMLDDRAARGEIAYWEALSDPQRHALTSYAGSAHIKVDRSLTPIALCEGDIIILMSDGVYNALCDEELCSYLKGDLYEAAERIERAILEKNLEEQDNFTAILAKFNAAEGE